MSENHPPLLPSASRRSVLAAGLLAPAGLATPAAPAPRTPVPGTPRAASWPPA